jgi:hypothetical protein
VIKWSQTSDLVPANLQGTVLQYLLHLPNENATAKISAQRHLSSGGAFRGGGFMRSISPYEEPPSIRDAGLYNYLPVGMFPAGSTLSQHVDLTLLSIIKAMAYTNNTSFIHDHGTNGLKTAVVKTQLKKHNIAPTTENLRSAQTEDREDAVKLMSAASSAVTSWNIDDPAWCGQTDVYTMKHGVDVTNFSRDTKNLFTSNDVAPRVLTVMGDGTGNTGGLTLTVYTDNGRKVGLWSQDDPDITPFQIRFAVSDNKDYPLRYSTQTAFEIDHHLYMKFKFPMFDCSEAAWPAWKPNKEYEPKRPYKWEGE